jgi:hypothetical protein
MPDKTIEQRVTDVEVEVADLRQEWQNIPDLIDARLRLTDSRVARLSSDMAAVKRSLADLSGKVEGLPRVLAEMLAERDKPR